MMMINKFFSNLLFYFVALVISFWAEWCMVEFLVKERRSVSTVEAKYSGMLYLIFWIALTVGMFVLNWVKAVAVLYFLLFALTIGPQIFFAWEDLSYEEFKNIMTALLMFCLLSAFFLIVCYGLDCILFFDFTFWYAILPIVMMWLQIDYKQKFNGNFIAMLGFSIIGCAAFYFCSQNLLGWIPDHNFNTIKLLFIENFLYIVLCASLFLLYGLFFKVLSNYLPNHFNIQYISRRGIEVYVISVIFFQMWNTGFAIKQWRQLIDNKVSISSTNILQNKENSRSYTLERVLNQQLKRRKEKIKTFDIFWFQIHAKQNFTDELGLCRAKGSLQKIGFRLAIIIFLVSCILGIRFKV